LARTHPVVPSGVAPFSRVWRSWRVLENSENEIVFICGPTDFHMRERIRNGRPKCFEGYVQEGGGHKSAAHHRGMAIGVSINLSLIAYMEEREGRTRRSRRQSQ
ncbi:unnamed protein product, partial [Mycena citricolor]